MNQQEIMVATMAALRPLVDGRVTTRIFPQEPGGGIWPAIRVSVISAAPNPDLCGDGGDEGADFRLQIDVVTSQNGGETTHNELRASVMQAMSNLGPEFLWDGQMQLDDEPTRTFRTALDYMIYLST